jgi:hypothetical protein
MHTELSGRRPRSATGLYASAATLHAGARAAYRPKQARSPPSLPRAEPLWRY